eukprot:2658858-Amphidinium_carterae.1
MTCETRQRESAKCVAAWLSDALRFAVRCFGNAGCVVREFMARPSGQSTKDSPSNTDGPALSRSWAMRMSLHLRKLQSKP